MKIFTNPHEHKLYLKRAPTKPHVRLVAVVNTALYLGDDEPQEAKREQTPEPQEHQHQKQYQKQSPHHKYKPNPTDVDFF